MATPQRWSPKNSLQKKKKKLLTLRLTQSNQRVGVDHATRIDSLNSPPMTSSVEKKKNDSDDDMYDMLEIHEQCEYIPWIINNNNNNNNNNKIDGTHTRHTKSQTKIIII